MTADYPRVDDIRAAMLARVDEYCRLTGDARSTIGKSAVNDPAFFHQIEDGRNFQVNTYKKAMDWLDAHWPEKGVVA